MQEFCFQSYSWFPGKVQYYTELMIPEFSNGSVSLARGEAQASLPLLVTSQRALTPLSLDSTIKQPGKPLVAKSAHVYRRL